MYSKTIMEKFQNPKNVGVLHGSNATGQVGGDAGADLMKIYLKIDDMKIKEAKFKAFGCAVSIAALDVMCDLIVNKSVDDALNVSASGGALVVSGGFLFAKTTGSGDGLDSNGSITVSGGAGLRFSSATSAHEKAINKLKKKAAEKGCGIVLIISENFGGRFNNISTITGEAYR